MTDYEKYRGKCKEFAERAIKENPELRLVRGHYYCTSWGKEAHWWTVKPNGEIFDPTKDQFPSRGMGYYEEYDGTADCSECGERTSEATGIIGGNGRYIFCSNDCYGRFVGVS